MAETMAELNKGDLEVYSTDEIQIGYVKENGTVKPLYKKTWTNLVTPTTSSQGVQGFSVQALGTDIGKTYGMECVVSVGDGREIPLPYVLPQATPYQATLLSARIYTKTFSTPNSVEMFNTNPGWGNLPVTLTLKYTK